MGRNSKNRKPGNQKPAQPKKVETAETVENENEFSVLKNSCTETEALVKAMEALATFEGNLKSEHSETHFKFVKIRG